MRYLLIVCVILAQACSTCPPCVPTHEVVEVRVPISSCPQPPDLPQLVLPPWPTLSPDATVEEIKTWYVDIVETYYARSSIKDERIRHLEELLKSYGAPQ